MRAIELFRLRDPLVLTSTHRLAKEMWARGVKVQTYHSFFRWSGKNDWTPERMEQKFIPRVTIWDEVCTVPRHILETFLDSLKSRWVQVVCCGNQGQPPPIMGVMPHNWLRENAYYEEIQTDHRAKDEELKDLKRRIQLQSDKIQCQKFNGSQATSFWRASRRCVTRHRHCCLKSKKRFLKHKSACSLPPQRQSVTEHPGSHPRHAA